MKNQVVTLTWYADDYDDGRNITKSPEDILAEWEKDNPSANIQSINRSDSGSVIANQKTAYTIILTGSLG